MPVIANQIGLSASRVQTIVREQNHLKSGTLAEDIENLVLNTKERVKVMASIVDMVNSGKALINVPYLK